MSPMKALICISRYPKDLVVGGPGLLQKVTTKKDKQTYHWKTNYTISNYCIVFNIGKYKVVSKDITHHKRQCGADSVLCTGRRYREC